MDAIIDAILNFFLKVFHYEEIVVALISVLPIVEARLAIPIGIEYGLGYFKSWGLSFLGTSLIVPILLLILIPFIKWLSKTKLFRKIGSALYDKFSKKSEGIATSLEENIGKKKRLSTENKKMLGVFLFVAIPLPLTGVWTGCAIASILGLRYVKSLVAVVSGNLVASLIILLLCRFFEPYIDYIILVLGIIALIVVILLIVKIILHKPQQKTEEVATTKED